MCVWYVESQRTDSPTEYNVDVLTLATQQLQSLDAAETPQRLDLPAKNTHRARKGTMKNQTMMRIPRRSSNQLERKMNHHQFKLMVQQHRQQRLQQRCSPRNNVCHPHHNQLLGLLVENRWKTIQPHPHLLILIIYFMTYL